VNEFRLRLVAMLLATAFCAVDAARAGDLQQLVQETQKSSQEDSRIVMVWWIPREFWEMSVANNSRITPEARTSLLAALSGIELFALLRGKTSIEGLTEVASREDLIANGRLESNGKVIEPLDPEKIGVGAQAILASFKPLLSGMLGQLGQGMQMVAYPAQVDKQRLIDPHKPGSFQYTLYGQNFKWRLPLASLLPKKIDPKTKEEFPGNFDFNPYTGGKLGDGGKPSDK
jgi:hypothetical protein